MTPSPTATPLVQQIHELHTTLKLVGVALIVLILVVYVLFATHRHGSDGGVQ